MTALSAETIEVTVTRDTLLPGRLTLITKSGRMTLSRHDARGDPRILAARNRSCRVPVKERHADRNEDDSQDERDRNGHEVSDMPKGTLASVKRQAGLKGPK